MDKARIIELGVDIGILIFAIIFFIYICKIKSKLRRFILRKGGE